MRVEPAAAALAFFFSVVASAADLTVNVVPAYLQLGSQPEAQVVIAGPEDLDALSLSVNHGSLGPARRVSPGRFVAIYRAPGQTFPRVAIIVAVGTSKGARIQAWTALPLWGSAEAVLQTLPNANVTVRIGDRTYGPLKADSKGVGKVAVVVPPGIRSGFYGPKVLDLGLPRVSLNHLVLDTAEVQSDREQAVTARFYSVTEDGKPRSGLALRARSTSGTLTDFRPETPGVYVATWKVPASAPGEVELSAYAPADANSTTTARLRLVAGPPSRVVIVANPGQLVAGTTHQTRLTARVTDGRGYTSTAPVAFVSSLGVIGPSELDAENHWTVTLLAPRGFGGASSIKVRAEVPGVAPAQVEVSVRPGRAQLIQVEPERLRLVSDGSSTVEVHAQLLDAERNVTEGTVAAVVPVGELTVVPENSSPGVQYRYRPARSLQAGATELQFSSNGLSVKVPVELLAAPSRLSFGPKVGFLTNLGNANALATALNLALWLGEHLGLGLEAGYLFVARNSTLTSGPLAGSRVLLRVHAVPLLGTFSWRGRLSSSVPFQATASGGAVVISSTLKVQDQQDVKETQVVPSAQLTASVGYQFGGWAPFLEAGVRWLGDARGNNLTGSLFSVGVSVGCRFDLL